MSHMTSIIRKELRELLTPGSVVSVLIMVVLLASLGGLIGGEVDSAAEPPTFGLVVDEGEYYDGWDPYQSLSDYYSNAGYDPSQKIVLLDCGRDSDSILSAMDELGLSNVIVIPDKETVAECIRNNEVIDVQQYYRYEPTGMFGSTVSTTVMSSLISVLNASLSAVLQTGDVDYDFIMSPISSGGDSISTIVNGTVHSNVTPSQISNEITSQTLMIPIVIMIIIMMVGSIVISSIGSEKENKTLETLLTMPIKRTSIVSGKIVAAAIVGLVYGLAYMVGMSFYMGSLMGDMGSSGVDMQALGMSLDATDWVLVMASMFLSIVCALGICMILGAFAKNYKSAQTMTMPISILAMIPMFVIMFTGWYGAGGFIQAITFTIPFSHPMMAMQALMNGDVTLVLGGIAYMAVFAVATILITVRLYNSDILITGLGQNKYVQALTGRK